MSGYLGYCFTGSYNFINIRDICWMSSKTTLVHFVYILGFESGKSITLKKKLSTMALKHLKHRETNMTSWNEYFGNSTRPLSYLSVFLTLAIRFACFHSNFLVIWNLLKEEQSLGNIIQFILQQLSGNSYQFCVKIYRSAASGKGHMRMHGINFYSQDSSQAFNICVWSFREWFWPQESQLLQQ